MTWIQRLYQTYEYVSAHEPADGDVPLLPICHTTQNAHIEVILDEDGQLLDAVALPPRTVTLIPSTEESAGRTSGARPHPLCDKLVYVAGDFADVVGPVGSGIAKHPDGPHRQYVEQLEAWANSPNGHPKVDAIHRYVRQGRIMHDLVERGVLRKGAEGRLLQRWDGDRAHRPPIFTALGTLPQHEALVRWRVEVPGDPLSATWEDPTLIASWTAYYRSIQTKSGFDMVTGEDGVLLAAQHPARLRSGADKAKLISRPSADTSGFTYRGRFLDTDEAASVSFEVTQKAHNALRWLIERGQAYRDGDQVFVIWSPQGRVVPQPWLNTDELPGDDELDDNGLDDNEPADTAEIFAQQLIRKMAGYHAQLGPGDQVVVLGLDSATPGRMAIVFYRELTGSDLLERLERWHRDSAWFQDYGAHRRFVGAPAPREIAEAAYGKNANEKLRHATVERLLPCIIDGTPIPRDLVASTVRRASNPASFPAVRGARPEWEKCLGIACALFRGAHIERKYQMALEPERRTRDYLYGRLLAVADNIERRALRMSDETRSTNAERLTQRFADRPYSTWRTIELALKPYQERLRSHDQTRGFLVISERRLDQIYSLFGHNDFECDDRLEGEFLLGFHAERRDLNAPRARPAGESSTASTDDDNNDDE